MWMSDSPENIVLQQFSNEDVKNGCEIPTLGRCKAYKYTRKNSESICRIN